MGSCAAQAARSRAWKASVSSFFGMAGLRSVHVDGRHVRIPHVGDEADPGGEKARVVLCAVDACREFGREAAADGRDVHPDLLEDPAVHLPADAAASGLSVRIDAIPWRERESCVASRLTLESQHGAGL